MSNSSVTPTPRHVSALSLAGEGSWPNLSVTNLSDKLNVFYGAPRTGKSSAAQLVGHLLYGKHDSSWRRQLGQSVVSAEGSATLEGSDGSFVLHRQYDAARKCRLTIASTQGDAVDGHTIQNLLAGLSPQLAARLYAVDFCESPRADWLLSDSYLRDWNEPNSSETRPTDAREYGRCDYSSRRQLEHVDSRRVDELVRRRDSIAGEIQSQLAKRRGESEVLEREISELDASLDTKRAQFEQLRIKLQSMDSDLAEVETYLRYQTLDRNARRRGGTADLECVRQQLADLDEEIGRSRTSLADIQLRQQSVRTELAQYGADGTADSVTCLADGRATLGVLEQLVDDLDAEVSQLARTHEPGRCIGHDAHAKLTPVAALLRQQIYALCGQFTEQERIVRRQQLTVEARQLSRVQVELGERLDLLLARREGLVQQSQLADQPTRAIAQPPVGDHCQCEHHGEFIQFTDAATLGRFDSNSHEDLHQLQQRKRQTLDAYTELQMEIDQLEIRWQRLQQERAGLISGASIEELQTELDRLEAAIRDSLNTRERTQTSVRQHTWRASDILAQLTDGQLTQIRIDRQQSLPTIVDRRGQVRPLESLSASEHDQLYLALTLALVSSHAQRGTVLPLLLDEPFLNQNDVQSATMLGVLDEFARAGHQVIVFTENYEIYRRSSTLAANVYDIETLRKPIEQPTVQEPEPRPIPTTVQTTSTRIVRQSDNGHSTAPLRLAPIEGEVGYDDEFYLTEASSFADFPVLGPDTERSFAQIDIYTVGELFAADAKSVASRLGRAEITADTVELWQIHMSLMCYVPNLTLNDAQVLAACDIDSPADLFDVDVDRLLDRIAGFLRSESGQRFNRTGSKRFTRSQITNWRDSARRYRNRWNGSQSRYSNWTSRRLRRGDRRYSSRPQPEKSTRSRSTRTPVTRQSSERRTRSKRPLKFYLSRHEDVEAAPSIGPKTATRLAKVGIRTVADLLEADAESTAAELDVSHISAAVLAEWQHQARLVCQIPGLRGYGAQLLVGCGLTQPDQIAGTHADQLVSKILDYCETKEGQRILRSGDPPKSEKIAEWVDFAAQSRPLEAA